MFQPYYFEMRRNKLKTQKPKKRNRIPTREFCNQSGLSNVTLWQRSKDDPDFPKNFYIGTKKLYYQDDVSTWIESIETETPPKYNLDVKTGAEA